jgi:hypothetical protein
VRQTDWSSADAVALRVLADRGGIARIGDFLAAGLTRHQVSAILGRGVMDRPRDAWYVDPTMPWQGKHAVRVGGVLACVSAAASHGLPIPPDAQRLIHVLMPHNAPRARHHRDKRHYVVPGEDTEVVKHWSAHDGTIPGWRTTLVDTLLALADCVPIEWWIAALDAALHRPRNGAPIMSDEQYAELVDRLPSRLRPELARVDPLAGSCLESLLRLGLVRRGVGPLVLQFSPRRNQFVDLLLPGKLIIEADGEAFHDPEKDAIRDASFRALGYRVMRFGYDRIVFDLEGVLDEIEAELAR